MVAEDPTMYVHPSPSGTNPHWQTEIDNGPHRLPRGKKKTNANVNDTRSRARAGTQQSEASNVPSSLDVSTTGGASGDARSDSKIDFKQYQREDEEMWGMPSMDRLTSRSSWKSNGVTRPPQARIRGADDETSYASYRNPPLNDYHPATVTKLGSREEAMWIFQPLPNADVMKGKEATPRSRSNSGNTSRLSVKSPVPMSRDPSQRTARGSLRSDGLASRGSTTQNASVSRSLADVGDVTSDAQARASSRTRNSPQVRITDDSGESAATVVRLPDLAPEPLPPPRSRGIASKPQLPTVLSDSPVTSDEYSSKPAVRQPKENVRVSSHSSDRLNSNASGRPSSRSISAIEDESLKVIREFAPSSAIFTSKVISAGRTVRASRKSSRQQSPIGEDGYTDLEPDFLDDLASDDFELPQWIHDHTRREVRERWSMDL